MAQQQNCFPLLLTKYLLNISGRPDRFFKGTRVKQEVLMKPVRSLPQVIEMLPDQDERYIYQHVYSNPLPCGVYRILYFFNNDSAYAGEMTLYVNCE